jgi:hypothetical protein
MAREANIDGTIEVSLGTGCRGCKLIWAEDFAVAVVDSKQFG